jgi:stearoyl-CoA desaturase (delta-9 desaturase)
VSGALQALRGWVDGWAGLPAPVRAAALAGRPPRAADVPEGTGGIDWLRALPFIALHAAGLWVLWTGWSPVAVGTAVALYVARMFAITGFYHRYFSHRSFRTGRAVQFVFAALGNASAQRGPLWWAGHHRLHHQVSDQPHDPHSPVQHGFLWSHMGWFLSRAHFAPRLHAVGDLLRYPELRLLDRFDWAAPLALGAALWGAGALLQAHAPGLGTDGPQMLAWGILSTLALFHGTFTINSLAHVWGRRRYATPDASRNNALLALITLGEGWHNNHHHCPSATPQAHRWWELDLTWYGLLLMQRLGLVSGLRRVPAEARAPAAPRARAAA